MMRMLASDFFARSPLLILPVIALCIFVAVFVLVTVRTYGKKRTHYEAVSRLPLETEE